MANWYMLKNKVAKADKERSTLSEEVTNLMTSLSKIGVCSESIVADCYNISKAQLDNAIELGFLQERNGILNLEIDGEKRACCTKYYSLDTKGQHFLKSKMGCDYDFYKYNSKHLDHDIKLSNVFHSLDRDIQDTWKTESQIKRELKENNPDRKDWEGYECIDASIEIDGVVYGIEVENGNYTKKTKEKKEEVSKQVGCNKLLWF